MSASASSDAIASFEMVSELQPAVATKLLTCDQWEPRKDSEPAIVPSVLFDQETVRAIDWRAVFGF